MTEQAQKELQAIVDRLGPNMWMVLDQVAFPRYFGTGVGAVATADAFFKRNHCACYFANRKTGPSVRFGRAYYAPTTRPAAVMPSRKKRPRDSNRLAKSIVDIATGKQTDTDASGNPIEGKDLAAVSLWRRGGLKGGKARAKALTPEQRAEIARAAASARWKKE